jgi:hypothetical protein
MIPAIAIAAIALAAVSDGGPSDLFWRAFYMNSPDIFWHAIPPHRRSVILAKLVSRFQESGQLALDTSVEFLFWCLVHPVNEELGDLKSSSWQFQISVEEKRAMLLWFSESVVSSPIDFEASAIHRILLIGNDKFISDTDLAVKRMKERIRLEFVESKHPSALANGPRSIKAREIHFFKKPRSQTDLGYFVVMLDLQLVVPHCGTFRTNDEEGKWESLWDRFLDEKNMVYFPFVLYPVASFPIRGPG